MMREKHRFKKEREFKKRLTETEENEEGDIRSFKFHRHDFVGNNDKPRPRRRDNDDDNNKRRGFDRRKKRGGFDRNNKRRDNNFDSYED